MRLKKLSHRSSKFLLLVHQKRLSNRPLLPKAFQQEALLLKKVWRRQKQHQIFNQLLQALQQVAKVTQE
jgi:hypothetical protein